MCIVCIVYIVNHVVPNVAFCMSTGLNRTSFDDARKDVPQKAATVLAARARIVLTMARCWAGDPATSAPATKDGLVVGGGRWW